MGVFVTVEEWEKVYWLIDETMHEGSERAGKAAPCCSYSNEPKRGRHQRVGRASKQVSLAWLGAKIFLSIQILDGLAGAQVLRKNVRSGRFICGLVKMKSGGDCLRN